MDEFDAVLGDSGAATRAELIGLVGRHRFDNAVKTGRLAAVFPRVYAYPWDVHLKRTRQVAALLSVGGHSALSHVSALDAYGLPSAIDAALHVTAHLPRHPRGVPGELVVHRTRFPLTPRLLDGLPVVPLESSLVSSWAMMPGSSRRAPVIEAWRRGLVNRHRLIENAGRMWWVAGVGEFRDLIRLLAAGCESELELWGYTHVFDIPGLDDATRQRKVRVGDATYRLDVVYEPEMLAVELDGREFHASPEQWERDIRRDVAVATLGWQTLRLSHRRLTLDVPGCRRDVLAVRAARRRLAG